MIAIKLGGSFITDKSKYRTFRKNETERALRGIIKFGEPFVLVHGAGSFGHILCKQSGFPGTYKGKESQLSRVKHDTSYLNSMITEILLDLGMAPMSFSPFYLRRKDTFDYSSVLRSVEAGFLPVMYGDIYIDGNDVKIYSGDSIMFDICNLLNPADAIFMGDVDGIFDRDPKIYPESKLLKTVKKQQDFNTILNDVTGGMGGKYIAMKKIASLGIRTSMMNGLYPERLSDLHNDNFYGSVIE